MKGYRAMSESSVNIYLDIVMKDVAFQKKTLLITYLK